MIGILAALLVILLASPRTASVATSPEPAVPLAAPPATTTRLPLAAFALSMDNLVVGFSLGVQHISGGRRRGVRRGDRVL